MTDAERILAANSPLYREIDEQVRRAARSFRSFTGSDTLNTACDYTAIYILQTVRKHLGLPHDYADVFVKEGASDND